jgi:hypothetical protein
VLSGLRDDAPTYNGDLADPFVLRTPTSLVAYASNSAASLYASAAHIPEIELTRASGFRGQYLGDALPELALGRHRLNAFESYLVAEFAAQYFCPQHFLQAIRDLRQAIGGAP